MPLFPYSDEEERRRRMLGPQFDDPYSDPAPSALPEISTARPPMMSAPGNPGAVTPPPSRRPSRYDEMQEAKGTFMQKRPSRLKAAGLGVLQAIGGGGEGGLGEAVGRGLGGAVSGAINPRGVRERQFNQQIRPQIMERFGAEDAERAAMRQAEQDALKTQETLSGIDLQRSQAEKNRLPPLPPAPPRPISSSRGLYDPGTRGIIPGTEPLPAPPRELAPRPVLNERGEYVDFNAETKAGRKVKAFQKPKGTGGKAKQPPKVVSMTQIRQYMKDTGKSRTDAIADAMRDGYRIAK